jgi:PAS domain S-box-containing protein
LSDTRELNRSLVTQPRSSPVSSGRRSEAAAIHLEHVLLDVPMMVWMTDAQGRCIFVNRQWLLVMGRTFEQELGYGWADSVHPEDRESVLLAYAEALNQHRAFGLDFRALRADGEYRILRAAGVPLLGADGGGFNGYVGSCVDVTEQHEASETLDGRNRDATERRQMESRLRELSRRLRKFSAHAEQAREKERRQLARTLHDELGQLFSSIRLELGAAIAEFRESVAPDMHTVVDRLQAAAGLTDIGVVSLRQLTTSLRPPILDHLGLVPAIRWEASLFSKRTGLRCHVRARPAAIALDEAQVTALYRILLAALDNIVRHAAAGTVWIHLTRQRGVTLMEIRDNGRGITQEQVNNPQTMGLLGMRERALALGGEVRVTRGRRNGTRLLVILPDADRA